MKDCTKDDCAEDGCGEGTLARPPPSPSHCGEEHCAERQCGEGDCAEEEAWAEGEDVTISLFISQMAYMLAEGRVTPKDIWEGMVLANCGDEQVATHIRDRAIAEASLYREGEKGLS